MRTSYYLLSLSLSVFLLFSVTNADDIILKPPISTNNIPQLTLIWIQCAECNNDAYQPLLTQLQQQLATSASTSQSLALWIGIPSFPLNTPSSLDISSVVDNIISNMVKQGMNTSAIFLGAHSSGGPVLQNYLQTTTVGFNVMGQILLGSFINRKYRSVTFKVPTLTIGGELDGVCRVTRIAEAYWAQITTAADFNTAVATFPVVVMNGSNHWIYAAGTPPSFIAANDLRAEITSTQAYQVTSELLAQFINVQYTQGQDVNSFQALSSQVQQTGVFVEPLIQALEQEGFYHFKPPCYDNPPSDSCTESCPWTTVAQTMMGGVSDNVTMIVSDLFHDVWEIFPRDPIPTIFNNCSAGQPNCVLNVSTVSECSYDANDKNDDGFTYVSASEIMVKLKSRQSIMEAVGYGNVNFNISDAPSLCGEINQQAYQYALSHAASSTLARYQTYGQTLVMGDDQGPYNIFPFWVWSVLKYNNVSDTQVQVVSSMLKTPVDFIIGLSAGDHFCKLLSPARAIEWIYIDSLRHNYHA